MKNKDRKFVLPFAELVDRLSIDQIKEVLLPEHKNDFAREMGDITHDIDLLVEERGLKLNSRLVRIFIALAQLNLHIWQNKDRMQKDPQRYDELLKFSHQLNGVRNQLKNMLLEETGDKTKSCERSNFNTDGLQGWTISIP
jgi:hypothetical protein